LGHSEVLVQNPPSPTSSEKKAASTAVPWWLWLQVLALDAPLVALAIQEVLACSHAVWLGWDFRAALFLSTWVIYLLDRTLDALRHPDLRSTRHEFCRRHHKVLLGLVIPALGWLLVWTVLNYLPSGALWHGLALGTLALVYLAVFAASPRSKVQSLLLLVSGAASLGFISQLPLSGEIKLAAVCLLGAFYGVAVVGRLSASTSQWLPRELLGSLIFSQACLLGVHFWSLGYHPFFCKEGVFIWGMIAFNLVSIGSFEFQTGHSSDMPDRAMRMATSRMPLGLAFVTYLVLDGIQNGWTPFLWCVLAALLCTLAVYQIAIFRRASAQAHHAAADLVLTLPLVAYLLLS
jgi:hypothetical protein